MLVRNVHERTLPLPVDRVGPLLDTVGGPNDRLWPSPAWAPMVLDRPVAVGAMGGHGPIRYRVTAYDPGRRVEFTFMPGMGIAGTHTLSAHPAGLAGTLLRHVVEARASRWMGLLWPLAVRWLHDAVLEDLLDRAESVLGVGPVRAARWSPWVRLLQPMEIAPARATDVPDTRLIARALDRVDWSDAHRVMSHPGMPTDPQVWADAIFQRPPVWLRCLYAAREAVVGLVGIERAGRLPFDTMASEPTEVLLGADARHLDFRVSVRREPDRVVVSTLVRLNGARGRAYFAVVRRVHPMIVRALLTRAARRFSRAPGAPANGTRGWSSSCHREHTMDP